MILPESSRGRFCRNSIVFGTLYLANRWAKRIVGGVMLAIMMGLWGYARHLSRLSHLAHSPSPRPLLRLMAVPFMAYILSSTTVHPWYLLILLAFLPFLPPLITERRWLWLKMVPWIYLSWAISLSYWTYINPLDLREFKWVRNTEWRPTLVFLAIWLVLRLLPAWVTRQGHDAAIEPSCQSDNGRQKTKHPPGRDEHKEGNNGA